MSYWNVIRAVAKGQWSQAMQVNEEAPGPMPRPVSQAMQVNAMQVNQPPMAKPAMEPRVPMVVAAAPVPVPGCVNLAEGAQAIHDFWTNFWQDLCAQHLLLMIVLGRYLRGSLLKTRFNLISCRAQDSSGGPSLDGWGADEVKYSLFRCSISSPLSFLLV